VLVLVVALLERRPFFGHISSYQEVSTDSQLIAFAGAVGLVQPGGDTSEYFFFNVRFGCRIRQVLVEELDEFVAPGGLMGALEEVVLGLRVVAPDAFLVGCCPDRAHVFSGWQPAVCEGGGELF
jgi:hypothetical protein